MRRVMPRTAEFERRAFRQDASLAGAVRKGWLTPPRVAGDHPPPRKPIMIFRDLMEELRHDREEE